jgi:hypothetical protein
VGRRQVALAKLKVKLREILTLDDLQAGYYFKMLQQSAL